MPDVEGTFRLAGLVEGRLPSGGETLLKPWLMEARAAGVDLTLSVDGGMFSLIPRTEESQSKMAPGDVSDTLQTVLGHLLDSLPEEGWRHCMCTLRSVEILPGKQRQALYTIGTGGEVLVEKRDVEADTVAPPEPMDPKKLAVRVLIVAGIVLLLFLGSLPFVPYGSLWERATSNLFTTPIEELVVEMGPFDGLLTVVDVGWDQEERKYYLILGATGRYRELRERENWSAGLTMEQQFAVEDIVRREIQLELETSDGELIVVPGLHLLPNKTVDRDGPNVFKLLFRAYPRLEFIRLKL